MRTPSTEGPDGEEQRRHDDICIHIFTVSATLVGVCLTVIGVLRLVERLQNVAILADQILSLVALGFLVSCTIAYGALRTRRLPRRRQLERAADIVFLASLGLMTAASALVALDFL